MTEAALRGKSRILPPLPEKITVPLWCRLFFMFK
jgi:hypothetical protein